MEYSDEAGNDPPTGEASETTQEQSKAYVVSSFTAKNFFLEGVTFSTVEFPSRSRTFSRSVMSQSQGSIVGEKDKEDSYIALVKDREELQVDDANSSGESIEVLEYNRHVVLCGKLCSRQEVVKQKKKKECHSNGCYCRFVFV